MKTKSVVFYALILTYLFICSNAHGQAREIINLNDQWKFKLGTVAGAEMPGYDDSAWDTPANNQAETYRVIKIDR